VVTEQLLTMFRRGTLKPGDRLPTEVEIMRLTGVGRSTVREAVRSLTSMQLVEVRPGSGTYVRAHDNDHLQDPLMLFHLSSDQALADLVEARRAVEPTIARLAAERARPEDVEALERALAAMAGRGAKRTRWRDWREDHLAFHTALARATHNIVLTRMWASVATFLRDSPLVGSMPPANWESFGLPMHMRLGHAIAAHDAERAASAMDAHVEDMQNYMQGYVARAAAGDRTGRPRAAVNGRTTRGEGA
jgi:GntR family transcriptional repressor for pyruvate dehydrogenase complex